MQECLHQAERTKLLLYGTPQREKSDGARNGYRPGLHRCAFHPTAAPWPAGTIKEQYTYGMQGRGRKGNFQRDTDWIPPGVSGLGSRSYANGKAKVSRKSEGEKQRGRSSIHPPQWLQHPRSASLSLANRCAIGQSHRRAFWPVFRKNRGPVPQRALARWRGCAKVGRLSPYQVAKALAAAPWGRGSGWQSVGGGALGRGVRLPKRWRRQSAWGVHCQSAGGGRVPGG